MDSVLQVEVDYRFLALYIRIATPIFWLDDEF